MADGIEPRLLWWWSLGLLLALLVLVAWEWPSPQLKLVGCDVGQGDAVLFVQGNVQVLVDGGPVNGKLLPCLNRHLPFWDRQIELVVVSHTEADHVGGLEEVFSRYQVKALMAGQLFKDECILERLAERQRQHKPKMIWASEGLEARVGELKLEVLWPMESDARKGKAEIGTSISNCIDEYHFGGVLAEKNARSLVAKVSYGDVEVLLTGDIPAEIEEKVAVKKRLGQVEVLKVAHHGSLTSTSAKLLENIHPAYALISVGKGNSYGHPHPTVLERLNNEHIQVLRTDELRDVVLFSDGNRLWH